MLKRILLACATTFFVTSALLGARAADNTDNVFLDEGDGDFESMPMATEAPVAPAGSSTQSTRSAENPANPAMKPSAIGASEDGTGAEATSANAAASSTAIGEEATEMHETTPSPAEGVERSMTSGKKAKKTTQAKKTAKSSSGKGGFKVTTSDCPMMRKPASEGSPMITVKATRKVWVEEIDQNWVRGFNKAGKPGYLNRSCFE